MCAGLMMSSMRLRSQALFNRRAGTVEHVIRPVRAASSGRQIRYIIYEASGTGKKSTDGQGAIDLVSDYRDVLRNVPVPCSAIAFSDDLTCPPHLCGEAAGAIPDCDYVEVGSCGHLGYLGRPDEVNSIIIEFLDEN
jgi:pimeloyl-ACP methyl ester carboxylesterase